LLLEWRKEPDGSWAGRVVVVGGTVEDRRPVELWVSAQHLSYRASAGYAGRATSGRVVRAAGLACEWATVAPGHSGAARSGGVQRWPT
jgi:hypothetical protein